MRLALCAALCLLWLIPVIYLVCLAMASRMFHARHSAMKSGSSAARISFAILVPARNEERVIGRLLKSLMQQDYPAELVEIAVVINGCVDETARVCAEYGARTLSVDNVASKGEALKWAFMQYAERRDIDAFVVLDADNMVAPGFLSAIDRAMRCGCAVCQGMRLPANGDASFVSKGYEAYYAVQNFLFNLPRTQRGFSSTINGSAFAVSKRLIDAGWFDVRTFIEDMEFAGICALHEEFVGFVEDAVTYDEQPTRVSTSWIQRRRWSTGLNQCRRTYGRQLLAFFLRSQWVPALDMWLLYFSPVINTVCAVAFAGSVLLQMFWTCGVCPALALGGIVAVSSWTGCVLLCNIALQRACVGFRKAMAAGAFYFPFFLLTWMAIDVVTMLHGVTEWKAIEHTGNSVFD